ncbi:hypothetical protein [Streptomyces sp. NPDC005209]|uniref:hypothetical protein n=1 Tax=Streptomyces sp. NPDC005209 TaxID=3156715 RepID=UPI0033AE6BA9
MTAMKHARRILLVTVTSIAALIGAGSAFAATGTSVTPDPSGARLGHNSYVRSVFGNTGSHALYYYNVGG